LQAIKLHGVYHQPPAGRQHYFRNFQIAREGLGPGRQFVGRAARERLGKSLDLQPGIL